MSLQKNIKSTILEIKQYSETTYDLTMRQFKLLKETNASISVWEDFQNDVKGALAVYKWREIQNDKIHSFNV